jgi:hypothetical protein
VLSLVALLLRIAARPLRHRIQGLVLAPLVTLAPRPTLVPRSTLLARTLMSARLLAAAVSLLVPRALLINAPAIAPLVTPVMLI